MREMEMSKQEFEELQVEAGYPFVSDEQAQGFRLRKILRLQVERMLEGPKVSARRVERE
jgi:hypothetical protein